VVHARDLGLGPGIGADAEGRGASRQDQDEPGPRSHREATFPARRPSIRFRSGAGRIVMRAAGTPGARMRNAENDPRDPRHL